MLDIKQAPGLASQQKNKQALTPQNGLENDHGFVFRRGRLSAPKTQSMQALEGESTAKSRRETMVPQKRQPDGPRLDFSQSKRRMSTAMRAASPLQSLLPVQEISVPTSRPPQPTPLVSRTRKRLFNEPKASSDAASRRTTAGSRKSRLGVRRRSTFSTRGVRASSIGGGFTALPHDSVGCGDFYRHISPELPEPHRLRQLLAWCARRTEAPTGGWAEELSASVRSLLDDVVREAVGDMHSALEKGDIATSWYHRPVDLEAEGQGHLPLKPHPENEANERARDTLKRRVAELRAEDDAWVNDLRRASAAHARTLDRLPRSVQTLARSCDGSGGSSEPTEWLARSAESIDWSVLYTADDSGRAIQRYVAEASPRLDEEIAEADRLIATAVDDLQVQLDAFSLDVHRAKESHNEAENSAKGASDALQMALQQRRAKAVAVAVAVARVSRPALDAVRSPGVPPRSGDSTQDLLRTLAAAICTS
ncbi:Mis12-Mtw1 protein family-domain-containing protein [Kickxella alabastrina]|uniref:Mis12-Mtw1 protein family-domain-containing protein n=1 Tax=Kickxella alabastrina TaxID=61397 RepID=UPI0022204BB7|nr:Mis12-Mtw1 protein family-domain-containing protein [Kickxella alabastrina]KAI7824447.1 Mis12-Mtw1 protein family-domain-containing protein [Kickxella alabastrina]